MGDDLAQLRLLEGGGKELWSGSPAPKFGSRRPRSPVGSERAERGPERVAVPPAVKGCHWGR